MKKSHENIKRLLKHPVDSYFLFGPRGVGKSTWIQRNCVQAKVINLLDTKLFLRLSRDPSLLEAMVGNLKNGQWVWIDEVQKVPSLLDEVQRLMGERHFKFALSGSSARKLKRLGANLLAGRAITRNMEGFSSTELGESFSLDKALVWGTLPLVVTKPTLAVEILITYVQTYIREEVREEGLVRKLEPFLRFLEIAALLNGQKVNLEGVAREALVPASSVTNYFSILVDTLIGHYLPAYRPAAKVREISHPKFYWFDCGVARAAADLLSDAPDERWLGFSLETYIFHELRVYNHTKEKYRFIGYYETGAGSEIDFVIETKKRTTVNKAELVCIEVKNSKKWKREWETPIRDLAKTGLANVKMYGIYRGKEVLTFGDFMVLPAESFLAKLFSGKIF